jgi:HD-GYP domain-containing protein (c-di-GMP phosphodiesterase class II)
VRILSVADTFDAICSKRSYKGKKSFLFAIEELLKDAKRNLLDQEIVQRFSAHIMESIKKKELKLRNGKSAEIIYVFLDSPTQPILSVEGSPLNLKKAGLTIDQVAIL